MVCIDSQFPNSVTAKKAKELGIPVVSMEEAEEYVINNPVILPDWRGTAGYNVAILNKLPKWGATAHYVDESIDTGAIIRVYKFNFDYRIETAQSLENSGYPGGIR